VLQAASCLCSKSAGSAGALSTAITWVCEHYEGLRLQRNIGYYNVDPAHMNDGGLILPERSIDFMDSVDLADLFGMVAWLNGLTAGYYSLVREPVTYYQSRIFSIDEANHGGIFSVSIAEAVQRAKTFGFCPHRVWAVASCLPYEEYNLPALIPPVAGPRIPKHSNHDSCTFDFCEESVKNFTSVNQRHECANNDCGRLTKENMFQSKELIEPVRQGLPTAWKLDGSSVIEPQQRFMAISHVWADGTGIGREGRGRVNECLYRYFCEIAISLGCEGLWWDTVCIPQEPEAKNIAIRNMHENYAAAEITLVHDLYLRQCEWRDAESAALAILLSSWFSRGWTALELARSKKAVKVIFKSDGDSLVIKDLDRDILAKPGEPSSTYRQIATALIRHLRSEISDVNSLLTSLSKRHTSWQRDRAIISGLLAGITVGDNPTADPDATLQEVYQTILLKKGFKVFDGNLFHRSATMSRGFSWCPTTLLDMPLATGETTPLKIRSNGDAVGCWQILEPPEGMAMDFIWNDAHPLTKTVLQLALRESDKHLLLVECGAKQLIRALLVKIMRKPEAELSILYCKFIGPIQFQSPRGYGPVGKIEVVIGDTEGIQELNDIIVLKYIQRVVIERRRLDKNVLDWIDLPDLYIRQDRRIKNIYNRPFKELCRFLVSQYSIDQSYIDNNYSLLA
jgi:hypothetical protein